MLSITTILTSNFSYLHYRFSSSLSTAASWSARPVFSLTYILFVFIYVVFWALYLVLLLHHHSLAPSTSKMLPSNPRAGGRSRSVARHPNQNNNAPRPRSVSRSADYTSRSSNSTSESPYYSRRDVQPTNKLRTQHSMGALSSSRTKRPTDAPPIPRLNPNHASAASSPSQYARPPPSRDSDTSTSSAATSSSGSSFLDRMKNRRHLNSSQSSFELDQDLPPKQLSNQEKSRASQDGTSAQNQSTVNLKRE